MTRIVIDTEDDGDFHILFLALGLTRRDGETHQDATQFLLDLLAERADEPRQVGTRIEDSAGHQWVRGESRVWACWQDPRDRFTRRAWADIPKPITNFGVPPTGSPGT